MRCNAMRMRRPARLARLCGAMRHAGTPSMQRCEAMQCFCDAGRRVEDSEVHEMASRRCARRCMALAFAVGLKSPMAKKWHCIAMGGSWVGSELPLIVGCVALWFARPCVEMHRVAS